VVRILRFRAQTAGTRPAHAVSRQASGPVNFLAHMCGSDGNGAKTHNLGNDTRDGKRRGEDSREIDWQKSVRSFLCPLGLVRRWVLPHRESRRHQKHTMCKILVKLKRLFLKRWSEHRSIEGFTSHETHIHGKEAHTHGKETTPTHLSTTYSTVLVAEVTSKANVTWLPCVRCCHSSEKSGRRTE